MAKKSKKLVKATYWMYEDQKEKVVKAGKKHEEKSASAVMRNLVDMHL